MYYLPHALDGGRGAEDYDSDPEPVVRRRVEVPSPVRFQQTQVLKSYAPSPTRYRGSPIRERRMQPESPQLSPVRVQSQSQTRQRQPQRRPRLLALGIKLFRLLTLSDLTISPFSRLKKAWELLGVVLISINLISYFSKDLLQSTFSWLPLADIYMIFDILLRFKTGYVDPKTGIVVMDQWAIASRYVRGWFLFDLVLSIPYSFIYRCWTNTASLQLFSALRQQEKLPPGKKAIWLFIRNKQYRTRVVAQFREALAEKRIVQNLLGIQPRRASLFRRTLRLIGGAFRLGRRLQVAAVVSDTVSRLFHAASGMRTLLIFSRARRNTE